MKAFKSILEFQKHFSDDAVCRAFLEEQRWGDTPCCIECGSVKVTRLKDGKRFQCNEKGCRKQFSATIGTIYENTKIPLSKWFLAMYILSNHSKGISSLQLAAWLDVTQKTAWFINHRIREMLAENEPEILSGIVEIDETYVGGKVSNKHVSKRKAQTGFDNKTMVVGAVQREGKVKTRVIPTATQENVQKVVTDFVEEGSFMVTDESRVYHKVKDKYSHATVNHGAKEYVRGIVHTNTIEGFWNILKKQIIGIHHSVSPKHLSRYCTEVSFRYNNRKLPQDERFIAVFKQCSGRLKYNQLIAKQ
ncbi:MAG: IS1595 family transposase [Bacteroidota bacterium]